MTTVRNSPSGELVNVGAAALQTLSNVFYADRATIVPSDDQDGNIETPFSTITAAVAAAPSGSTIVVCPGDYSGESPVAAGSKALTFRGEVGQLGLFVKLPVLTYAGGVSQFITYRNVFGTLRALGAVAATIYLFYCPTVVLEGTGNTSLVIAEGDASGIVSGEGGLLLSHGTLLGEYVNNSAQGVAISEGSLFGSITSGGSVTVRLSQFGPGSNSITAPNIFIDNFSKKIADDVSFALNGTITIIGANAKFNLPGLVIGSQGAQGVQTLVGDGAGGWMQGTGGSGSQGPQGAQGAQGSGSQGPQGAQGAQGADGGGGGSPTPQFVFWESHPGLDDNFMIPWTSLEITDGSTANPTLGAIPAPFDGTASLALMVGDATTGVDVVHTVLKNGVPTSIVVTVPTGDTFATDDVNTFSFNRGDFLQVQITSGGGAGDFWKFALGLTPSSGGSGGSTVEPLTKDVYVDVGRTTSTEDGSIAQPFKTIQAGINAVGSTSGAVLIADGDYSGESVTIAQPMTLRCVGNGITLANIAQTVGDLVNYDKVDATAATLSSGSIARLFRSRWITVTSHGGNIIALESGISTMAGDTGASLLARGSNFGSMSGMGPVSMSDCNAEGISAELINLVDVLAQQVVTATDVFLTDSRLTNALTATNLTTDSLSLNALRQNGFLNTVGTLTISDHPFYTGVTFTVPTLAADMADVTAVLSGARPGDTFNLASSTRLAGVGIVDSWCDTPNVITVRFFGTTAGGDVVLDVNLNVNSP